MQTLLIGLLVSVLWLAPLMLEAGESGRAGEQRPEQARLLTTDQLQKVQERLHAEGMNPGPRTGAMNPQTAAALRRYQETQGVPVTGAAETATLEKLQIELPPAGAGEGGTGGRERGADARIPQGAGTVPVHHRVGSRRRASDGGELTKGKTRPRAGCSGSFRSWDVVSFMA